ncbi:MAG: cyclodeaminase/cyclohydrolase family protein [Clostridiales Family XIII bacterium]|jgi:formiminotetrahydrofolate cyclodeaminase|nr:cyclodeaminase/cyclohydrolase family protein [Clostridiales Family XIII bacterium]
MRLTELSCEAFTAELAGAAPVPGGGGASALAGAVGIALGGMVASLTVGKRKYADVEADMRRLSREAEILRLELLALVQRDAEAFEPLARVYRMPNGTASEKAERLALMEGALKAACAPPLDIMRKCCAAIELLKDFAEKGSRLAVSDAGVGALLCKAALSGASLNVFVNTAAMEDRTHAARVNGEAERMLAEYGALADAVHAEVLRAVRRGNRAGESAPAANKNG